MRASAPSAYRSWNGITAKTATEKNACLISSAQRSSLKAAACKAVPSSAAGDAASAVPCRTAVCSVGSDVLFRASVCSAENSSSSNSTAGLSP